MDDMQCFLYLLKCNINRKQASITVIERFFTLFLNILDVLQVYTWIWTYCLASCMLLDLQFKYSHAIKRAVKVTLKFDKRL